MNKGTKKLCIFLSAIVCLALISAAVYAALLLKNNSGTDTSDTASTAESLPQKTEESIPEKTEENPEESSEALSSKDAIPVKEYTATMYTVSDDLNVRPEPGTDNKPIGTLPFGTAVSVTGKASNGWYRIDYNGRVAYCFGAYLSAVKKEKTPAATPYYIKVNRAQSMLVIYKKDADGEYTVPVKAMACSVGRQGHETPKGTYKLSDKYTWACLSGGVWGQYVTRITGPYLFHSVPYYTKSKSNLEYEQYNKLGQPASKGCVRLSVADAKWIFDNCAKGTKVTIYDSSDPEPLEKPTPIKIDVNDSRKGWDPTDPDPKNPWKTN